MAYPPERITVKRHRDEDPIEALCEYLHLKDRSCLVSGSLTKLPLVIQQKKQRPSGFWKLVGNENDTLQYAEPITFLNPVTTTQATTTVFDVSKPRTVKTNARGEDFGEQRSAVPRSLDNTKLTNASATAAVYQLPSECTQTKESRQNTNDFFASASKARKFHLLKDTSPVPSPFLVPKTIAQRHRDKRRKDLAIFVERREISRKAKHRIDFSRFSKGESRHVDSGNKNDKSQPEKPRKRANATDAERKWRTDTWTIPPKSNEVPESLAKTAEDINEPSNRWNYESIRLTDQLQAVALEEIRASDERAKGLNCSGKLKVKPKAPKDRQPTTKDLVVHVSDDDYMTDTINTDDDGDYVLDTYIRSNAQPFEVTKPTGLRCALLHGIDHSNIGILVVEDDEEEAMWEAFAEDQDSDPEWNSEEDENGL